jgi:hypothetical protein
VYKKKIKKRRKPTEPEKRQKGKKTEKKSKAKNKKTQLGGEFRIIINKT